jgi:hypothetical protein
MSQKTLTTWQKATALVPLALLSGAWTTSLTLGTAANAESSDDGRLPDGTSVPDQAIKAPASVSNPGEIAPGVPTGSAGDVIAAASTNGIPAAALAAYQRAARVIDTADKGCQLDWTLIAAIGRVESNHGRYGGNTLTEDGLSRPGIYGIPLDGSSGTAQIKDTDAAQYDNDPQYDRAVGPMQFIPSTWSVVGVDGDGDGKRDPQDIDDAALATAVYLCSGDEDLSTTAGQRSSVFRYNHSQEYVDLVLSIMRAYAQGDFSSVPTSSAGSTTFTPDYGDSVFAAGTSGYRSPKFTKAPKAAGGGSSSAGGSSAGSGASSSAGGSGGGTGGSTGAGGGTSAPEVPAPSGADDPVKKTQDTVKKAKKTVDDTTKTVTDPVIGLTKATQMCASAISAKYGSAPQQAVSDCANRLKDMTLSQAQANLGSVVADLKGVVCGLLPLC